MLHKGLKVIKYGFQTYLAQCKKSLRNTLKFVGRNRSSRIPDLALESFSSVTVVAVHFPFMVAPQIKITNAKIR
jgi:hypothetical protein